MLRNLNWDTNHNWEMLEPLDFKCEKKPFAIKCACCRKKMTRRFYVKPDINEPFFCSEACEVKFFRNTIGREGYVTQVAARFVLADFKKGSILSAWEVSERHDISVPNALGMLAIFAKRELIVLDRKESKKSPVPKWKINPKQLDKGVARAAVNKQDDCWRAMAGMIKVAPAPISPDL